MEPAVRRELRFAASGRRAGAECGLHDPRCTGIGEASYSPGAVKLHLENMTQRSFSIVIAVLAVATSFAPHSVAVASGDAPENAVSSPNGAVAFHLHVEREKPLQYDVAFGTHPVIERSRLGIVVDGKDLAVAARIERVERYEIIEKYPARGVHSVAVNHCNGAKYS